MVVPQSVQVFLKPGGRVTATVNGPKVNIGLAYGLEISFTYTFVGQVYDRFKLHIKVALTQHFSSVQSN